MKLPQTNHRCPRRHTRAPSKQRCLLLGWTHGCWTLLAPACRTPHAPRAGRLGTWVGVALMGQLCPQGLLWREGGPVLRLARLVHLHAGTRRGGGSHHLPERLLPVQRQPDQVGMGARPGRAGRARGWGVPGAGLIVFLRASRCSMPARSGRVGEGGPGPMRRSGESRPQPGRCPSLSKEICEAHDILLCPRGDHSRRYQQLSDTCTFAKVCHTFAPCSLFSWRRGS